MITYVLVCLSRRGYSIDCYILLHLCWLHCGLMQRGRRHHRPPWFSSQRSWRKVWPSRWLGSLGGCPFRGPWSSPIQNRMLNQRLISILYLLRKKEKEKIARAWRNTYRFGNINHWCFVLALSSSISCRLRDEWPQLVGVDSWAILPISLHVENSHSGLTIEPWVAIKMFKHSFKTYNLFIMILSWCIPPALPLPPGLFLCLPTLPWPMDTWPLIDLVFFNLATYTMKLAA